MSFKINKVLKQAIEFYGEDHQIKKAIEELAELIVALAKMDIENIKEEIVDCEKMIEQIKYILKISDSDLNKISGDKLTRLIKRLKNEKKENL